MPTMTIDGKGNVTFSEGVIPRPVPVDEKPPEPPPPRMQFPAHIVAAVYLAGLLTGFAARGEPAKVALAEATLAPIAITVETYTPTAPPTGTPTPETPSAKPTTTPLSLQAYAADIPPDGIVSVKTWLTGQPIHAQGRLIRYGPDSLTALVAHNLGYDLTPYKCGVAMPSPADLGKIVWLRVGNGPWYGPCLSMDVARRQDFYEIVYRRREVAEVSDSTRAALGNFPSSAWGETFLGECPPPDGDPAYIFEPKLIWDTPPHEQTPSNYPYPAQEMPGECK